VVEIAEAIAVVTAAEADAPTAEAIAAEAATEDVEDLSGAQVAGVAEATSNTAVVADGRVIPAVIRGGRS
jgi:hypothetical protein